MENTLATVKDIVTIGFYLTGSVVAILTYLRARATVLQPKRTELVKKQTELFSKFLTFVNENENSLDHGFDYVGVFGCNVDLCLREYGLIEIPKTSEKYIEYKSSISGCIQFLENDIHNHIFVNVDMDGYDQLYFEANDRERQKYYQHCLANGSVKVHRIFYTKKHENTYKVLREFSANPFLPEKIQKIAYQIGKDQYENIHVILRLLLQKLVSEYSTALNGNALKDKLILTEEFRHSDLYKIFEQERIKHDEAYNDLKMLIRSYLHIDEKW